MATFTGDLKLGLRKLRTQPGHSLVVITTLGLALGLCAVIFSFVSFFALRPLPVRDESTMVRVRSSHPQQNGARLRLSYADFVDFRAQATTLEQPVALSVRTGALTGEGDAQRVAVGVASAGLFKVWDIGAAVGRVFVPAEDAEGSAAVMLIGHGYWERQFAKSPGIVGRTLILDGRPTTVAGIVSPSIEIGNLADIDVWIPLGQSHPSLDRERRDLMVSARRKPGVTLTRVNSELATIAARLEKEHPGTNKDWTASAVPLREGLYGSSVAVILALLVVGVCLVFAVACANVAGIMLARATTREREMALRMSLGAERGQLARQLMAEGVVLSGLGALLGLGVAQLGLLGMRAVAFEQFYDLVVIDWRVLAFCGALALLAPLLFGLAPALQLAGRQLSNVLRDAGASAGTSGRVGRSRRGLVIMQIGLATALLMMSGLSVRTAVALRHFDFGFDTGGLLTVRVDLSEARYDTKEKIRARAAALEEALRGRPQTGGVSIGTDRPVFDRGRQVAFRTETSSPEESRIAMTTTVTPEYFRTLGVRVLQGREFLTSDAPEGTGVAVVNQALVARDFAGRDPLGQRVQVGGPETPWLEIVGVVANIANPELGAPPAPQAYLAFAQRPERSLVLFARTENAAAVLAFLRETMRTLDPDQPLYDAKTMEQVAWEELASNRIITGLFVALGCVSLALAAVGLYGLTAFLVAQRSREIGVRMALGASVRDVLRLVVSQGAWLTASGLAAGLALGLGLGRTMASVLIDIKPWDPLTVASTIATLGLVAVLAHWIPARRAASINPVEALRRD
jgi:predicted permease